MKKADTQSITTKKADTQSKTSNILIRSIDKPYTQSRIDRFRSPTYREDRSKSLRHRENRIFFALSPEV
ncbi:hypothetical protein DPMN_193516 [Dreissena polymorpha]|uniref:Uncharacterized protein n=1 Tax=Dreissena polymorpha TaxID=45954 RepID=A0A9D3XXR7_DREPO|nr:hypothetical protein DPMN_193516 [Dreissena polymorpha]